ncbi:MAG TPA: DNA topoisomerase IB [Candidatus Binatia bacterium]
MPITVDPAESASVAHLRYVSDAAPGIHRRRAGRGFAYVDAGGSTIRDAAEIRRIHALAIPPAWTDVWICPLANGHIQATGRDARGRKQYRYHPRWRATRDETKYGRMIAFGEALPRVRARLEHDLALPGLPREKVLATVVALMERTAIRVGNEEYAKANDSFGLTTLRNRHVAVAGDHLRFAFRGKSGKRHTIDVADRRLARIVRRCKDIPGWELFQYLDESGTRFPIGSADVNDYLREISGADFTAKDFRTWAGTVLAAEALQDLGAAPTASAARRNLTRGIAQVAEQLGNTVTVCRKCYVHPAVIDGYLAGTLLDALERLAQTTSATPGLRKGEAVLLALLRAAHADAAEPVAVKLARSVAAARASAGGTRRGRSAPSPTRASRAR